MLVTINPLKLNSFLSCWHLKKIDDILVCICGKWNAQLSTQHEPSTLRLAKIDAEGNVADMNVNIAHLLGERLR